MRIIWLAMFVAPGCEPLPPQSLDDLDFPAGFQLDTQPELSVAVRAGAVDTSLPLAIDTADGRRLYRGPASFAVAHGLLLRIPPDVSHLRVILGDGPESRVAVVRDGTTEIRLD